jgi:hypothetical protein
MNAYSEDAAGKPAPPTKYFIRNVFLATKAKAWYRLKNLH